jgi:hypothetical protein
MHFLACTRFQQALRCTFSKTTLFITIVDTATDAIVNQISLTVTGLSGDPAPDLLDISPDGTHVFATLRGPHSLTGNNPTHNNAVGATPGLTVFRVTDGGRSGVFEAIAPITHPTDGAGNVNGMEHADLHAIAVRRKSRATHPH